MGGAARPGGTRVIPANHGGTQMSRLSRRLSVYRAATAATFTSRASSNSFTAGKEQRHAHQREPG
jgi:hypothetical protein